VLDADLYTLTAEVEHSLPGPQAIGAAHFRAALDGVPLGLMTFNRTLGVLSSNSSLAAVLGMEPLPPVPGSPGSVLDLLSACSALDQATALCLRDTCLAVIATGNEQRIALQLLSGPVPRRFAVQVFGLEDGSWMASFEEVTARFAAEASAAEQMMCDPLTGLPNRQLFQKRLVAALEGAAADGPAAPEAGPAVMLVDLDRFKAVNDTLGHPVGDGLLRLIAKRLRSALRPGDLIARLGGDEFAIMVSPAPPFESLAVLAHRVVDMLSRPYLVDGYRRRR